MLNTTLATNDFASFQDGMRQQEKDNRASRLSNRDAFMKFSKDMSDQGKTMSMEDWAGLSKDVLGPTAWLSVNNPSQDAMNQMMSQQTAAAQQTAEVRRREQFKSDQEESKAVLADVHDQFLSGKSPVDALQYAHERYGPDLIGRLNLNFDQEQQKALWEAQVSGKDQGAKMYQTVDQAKADLADKDFIPQVKKDALIAGAQANQSATEANITKEAMNRGTEGWIGDAADEQGMRAAIRTLIPSASKEYEEKLLSSAMATAMAQHRNAIAKRQSANAEDIRTSDSKSAPAMVQKQLEMEMADDKRRTDARTAITSQFMAAEQNQAQMAASFADKGRMPKGMDPAKASEATVGLRSYIFDNPDEYVQAVISGNKDKMKSLIAAATPVSEHRAKAEALGQLVTGNFTSIGEAAAAFRSSGLGLSADSIMQRGKEIKLQEDIAKTTKPGLTIGQRVGDAVGTAAWFLGAKSWGESAPKGSTPGDEIANTAKANAEKLKQGFVDRAAQEIKGFRDALRQNTHVGATSAELQQYELGMAMSKARSLLTGMGVRNEQMELDMAQQILQAAGAAPDIQRQALPSERFKTGIEGIRRANGLTPDTAVLPGAGVASPRAASTYPAANF